MKYSDFFLSAASRSTSAILGLLTGVAVGIFAGWEYGILFGVAAAILLSVILPLIAYRRILPYEKLKAKIQGPFLFDEQVVFHSPKGSFGGFFLLKDASMVLMTLGKGKMSMELSREDVRTVMLDDDMTLRIFLNDTQYICIFTDVAAEIFSALAAHGWSTKKTD